MIGGGRFRGVLLIGRFVVNNVIVGVERVVGRGLLCNGALQISAFFLGHTRVYI